MIQLKTQLKKLLLNKLHKNKPLLKLNKKLPLNKPHKNKPLLLKLNNKLLLNNKYNNLYKTKHQLKHKLKLQHNKHNKCNNKHNLRKYNNLNNKLFQLQLMVVRSQLMHNHLSAHLTYGAVLHHPVLTAQA